jgi:hypothetical protein
MAEDYRSWAKVRPVRCEGGAVDDGQMTKVRPTNVRPNRCPSERSIMAAVGDHRSMTGGQKASEVRQNLSTRKVFDK